MWAHLNVFGKGSFLLRQALTLPLLALTKSSVGYSRTLPWSRITMWTFNFLSDHKPPTFSTSSRTTGVNRQKFFICTHRTRHSPKRELANPYHLQPYSPMSHLPCRLAAKLKGVPKTHTRMSLTLMFNKMRLMGVQRERNFAKMTRASKLLTIPATKMKPRKTATTVWPVRLSPPGLWDTWESKRPASVLMLELEKELSAALKLQPRMWTTIAVRGEQRAAEELDTKGEAQSPAHHQCSSYTLLRPYNICNLPAYTPTPILSARNTHSFSLLSFFLRISPVIIMSPFHHKGLCK